MGKATGFLEYERKNNTRVNVKDRINNFDEFYEKLSIKQRQEQASRCMDCGVPFCQSAMKIEGKVVGCPLHNLIPEFNDEVYKGHVKQALSRLLKTNNFPEFTSRVCPACCEKACLQGMDGKSVTVHDNENYIIETAYEKGYMNPKPPKYRSSKKVAVIGSGPSGLACSDELNKRGHHVTVFERDDEIGGLLMYGIPNMKLDKSIILRRKVLMEEEGIVFKTNTNILNLKDIKDQYDAIVIATGSKKPRALANVNMKVKGISFAVDYLTRSTKALLKHIDNNEAKNKNVVIVGGGDTGNDCVGTSIRQGCKSVIQLEMMPQPPKTRTNQWPAWPNNLKVDYGQEEAIYKFHKDPRIFQTTVKSIKEDKGVLKEITIINVEFKDGKLNEIVGSEKTIPCDLLLIAAGFVGVDHHFNLPLTNRGVIDNNQYYCQDNIFTCGDARVGQSLVVNAIKEGRACSLKVDEYLMGYKQ